MSTESITFDPRIETVLKRFTLTDTIHGPGHWARVLENGLRLAPFTGADKLVISLFAIFHDSCRENDGMDLFHGPRAAKWVRDLDLPVNVEQHALLIAACAGHTNKLHSTNPTLGTCWDADRLDIGRTGMKVDPRFMSTPAAKNPALLAWAQERSERGHVPAFANRFI